MSGVLLMFLLSASAVALILVCVALVIIGITDFIDDFGEDDDE